MEHERAEGQSNTQRTDAHLRGLGLLPAFQECGYLFSYSSLTFGAVYYETMEEFLK